MSFFFLSQSEEENHLFENIVSFELDGGILLYILPFLEKKRGALKYGLICQKSKPVQEDMKMES